ncbi:type II secretion system F family protein [Neokomagataea anthophila]|uniref:Type II secretion system F family protein n=1 Tax=Neokomagataea anthophila TaxID=2826925 RepID=A0ABS5E9M4_9PROT|nr:type II secretion system F family protein [Neokomagataea anthophila]
MAEGAISETQATLWQYRAVGVDGVVVTGELNATGEAQVIASLRQKKLMPLDVRHTSDGGVGRAGGSWLQALRRTRFRPADISDFTRKLATMLGAGLDLDRALRFLGETAPSDKMKALITQLRDRVRDGASFADALEATGGVFSKLYVGLVRAGEAGGALHDALERLADVLERERRLAATIQSAMIYPTVLMIASIGSVVLLLTHVLPQFVPLFEENGVALPMMTRVVIAAGDVLTHWGLFMLIGVGVCVAAGRMALRRPDIRFRADHFLLRVPVIGTLLRHVMAAQLTRTLGTLLQNGVSLVGALRITGGVIGNRSGAQALTRATGVVREGGSLAVSLERADVYPREMTHFLRVGEETAQLASIALRAADVHEEAVRVTVQRLLAILVPAITVIMGLIVAGIVSALLLAMLSLNDLAH